MPCGCEDEEKNLIPLRFVGGRDKPHGRRGPYRSYETGKVYEKEERWVVLPYWERADGKEAEPEIMEEPEVEIVPEFTDKEVPSKTPSPGLTKKFSGRAPTGEEFIMNMGIEELKVFIIGQGGKVDGRWKTLERLRQEALKLL